MAKTNHKKWTDNKLLRRCYKLFRACKCSFRKDRMILCDERRPTVSNRVNLHWCSENRTDGKENVGDLLSVPIFEYMLNYYQLDGEKELSKIKHLFGVGSILFFGPQDATVWGSGVIKSGFQWFHPRYDIRLVRGPETRKLLLSMGYHLPELYGDPAVIMPLIYQPASTVKRYGCGIILHKNSRLSIDLAPEQYHPIEIVVDDYRKVIDEIVQCKKIITTALHGIILAETYRVPAILVRDDRSDFNLFKYNDYYHSTGRFGYPVAGSFQEAMEMTPPPLPELEQLRQNVIRTFPVDLWE